MSIIRGLDRLLVRVETVLLVVFLSVMILVAFLQVVLRNLFAGGLIWGDPLARQMVLWSGFIGAAMAASQERHISIDALTKYLSPRVRAAAQVLTNLFAAVVCYFLGRAAWTFVADERTTGSELFLEIPSWIGLLIIPAGYWLLVVHFALNVLTASAALLGREPPPAGAVLPGEGPRKEVR